jgi:putative glutamine amidotransferase
MELKLIKLAYQRNIPVLGICAGMQEMNVALGGTLTSNLKKTFNITTEHRNENREKIQHKVTIEPNTQLYHIVKNAKFGVNSNHREGLKEVSPVLNINARATDGVVEGIEAPKKQFFIGVMWHPEFQLNKEEEKLWQAFLDAATKYQATRA